MKKSYSVLEMKMFNISMEEKIALACMGGQCLKFIYHFFGCHNSPKVNWDTSSCLGEPYGDLSEGIS